MSEFRQVVGRIGLDRKNSESYQDYVKRIRDEHGVLVNRDALIEAAFEESKKEIESDLIFTGQEDALGNLRRLHFRIDPICNPRYNTDTIRIGESGSARWDFSLREEGS